MLYLLPVIVGAFLLFQVQPLIARLLLPLFGGGASVWTACMLFFQTLLLGGYSYAHLLGRYLAPLQQRKVHSLLLVVALAVSAVYELIEWAAALAEVASCVAWRAMRLALSPPASRSEK